MVDAERGEGVVLIVDDQPDNLSLLHDALDGAGYTVLVATGGPAALERAARARPDVILLDALMPGMDGFEVARRLKADPALRPIPIVFMTALVESEHVVASFAAGGTDYVSKPLRPSEVLARIGAHIRNARQASRASSALDAFGQATVAVSARDGRLLWQTALARRLLEHHFGPGEIAPPALLAWIRDAQACHARGGEPPALLARSDSRRLLASYHDQTEDGEWLVVLREEDEHASILALMRRFRLTPREAEVLHWLSLGKTNRDIAEILSMSPRTVNKHLEHVFDKLSVETRTAAATLAHSANR
ncbi:response regulator [Crenobacter intestini]|uniref:Response regulator n=1 Tax=Crenobacter intestini TaxID=2563443 RepID=A0A4T0V5V3_9NEIS|nr:response regulator [Crenobacter intestini]TIC87148.1 response regulator [Crenobacter intestini]